MILRSAVIATAWLLGCFIGPAGAQSAIGIKIVEYGIYTAEVVTPPTGANENMKAATIKNICHVATTTTVPARDDLHFGLRFRVDGPPAGGLADITIAIRFPDHMKPPTSPVSYTTNEQVRRLRVGQTSFTGWTNWKTRPGTWTFQLSHENRKLAGIDFAVVDRGEVRVRPDGDSTCFQMSSL